MRSTTLGLGFISLLLFTLPASAADPPKKPAAPAKPDAKADAKPDETKDDKDDEDDKDADGKPKDAKPAIKTTEPPAETWDIYDVEEKPGKTYFFVGLRYRGNVIPDFILNIFVDEGKTIYTNQIGAEFEVRKDGFSLIPALTYHELGTGDILFRQKSTKDLPQNYSDVNSGMKVVYAQLDVLWSVKLHKNVEFEYGGGVGVGAVFGDLENSWVQSNPGGPLTGSNGQHYSICDAVGPKGTGCNAADHQNASVNKIAGYKEPSWFNGGSKPAIFPWLSIPQVGLRIKPMKNLVGRIGIGFALTGFWFGLSAQYGLEKKPE